MVKRKPKKRVLLKFRGLLSFLILHELRTKHGTGDELAQRIGLRRGKPLTPGTIYPTLKRLKKLRLITSKRYGRKKVYRLTKQGRSELKRLYKVFGLYFAGLKQFVIPVSKLKALARKAKNK